MILKELQYVLAIEKYGSISKAASTLYISQPALSRYISSLEETLGIGLFERIGNKLFLTENGKQYIATARSMLAIYSHFEECIKDNKFVNRGSLRIGTSVFRASHFLPLFVPAFIREYPDIELSIVEDSSFNLERKLINNELDVTIMSYPVTHQNIVYHEFSTEEVLLAVPNKLHNPDTIIIEDYNTPFPTVSLDQFKNDTLILNNSFQRSRVFFDSVLTEAHFVPKRIINTTNITSALNLCDKGVGISFLTDVFASIYIKLPNTSYYSLQGRPTWNMNMFVAHRNSPHLPGYIRRFVELCLQEGENIKSSISKLH